MGAPLISEYICDRKAWDIFLKSLFESSLHIKKQEGDLETETGISLELTTEKNGSQRASVLAEMTYSSHRVLVTIMWFTPRVSRKIAEQIEELLFKAGADCLKHPIGEANAKRKAGWFG